MILMRDSEQEPWSKREFLAYDTDRDTYYRFQCKDISGVVGWKYAKLITD